MYRCRQRLAGGAGFSALGPLCQSLANLVLIHLHVHCGCSKHLSVEIAMETGFRLQGLQVMKWREVELNFHHALEA
jgi:hypothetical protein